MTATEIPRQFKFDVTATFKPDEITLLSGRFAREVLNLKDRAVRGSLSKLGWLSPEEAQALRAELEEAKNQQCV